MGLGGQPISPFVEEAVRHATVDRAGSILDLACGFGRHALWLADHEYRVTAVDIDEMRVGSLRRAARPDHVGSIACLVADCSRPLPFRPRSFDAAVVVHFVPEGLADLAAPVIRPGGHLIIETFGGHGGNWQALPRAGAFRKEIEAAFDLLIYRERPVGPTKTEAVAVKLLARKR